MNLYEQRTSLECLYNRIEKIRCRLNILDCTKGEAQNIPEPAGLLNELAVLIERIEDSVNSIEYSISTLLGIEK